LQQAFSAFYGENRLNIDLCKCLRHNSFSRFIYNHITPSGFCLKPTHIICQSVSNLFTILSPRFYGFYLFTVSVLFSHYFFISIKYLQLFLITTIKILNLFIFINDMIKYLYHINYGCSKSPFFDRPHRRWSIEKRLLYKLPIAYILKFLNKCSCLFIINILYL
jgi:hypothetical protein